MKKILNYISTIIACLSLGLSIYACLKPNKIIYNNLNSSSDIMTNNNTSDVFYSESDASTEVIKETWVLNDIIYVKENESNKFYCNFTSNGFDFGIDIIVQEFNSMYSISYDEVIVAKGNQNKLEIPEEWRTITFNGEPTGNLLIWLQENATKK